MSKECRIHRNHTKFGSVKAKLTLKLKTYLYFASLKANWILKVNSKSPVWKKSKSRPLDDQYTVQV